MEGSSRAHLLCLKIEVFFLTEHENALKRSQDGAEVGAQLPGMQRHKKHLAQECQQQ